MNIQFVQYKNNQYLENSNTDGIRILQKFLHEQKKYYDWDLRKIITKNSFIEELQKRNYDISSLTISFSSTKIIKPSKIRCYDDILQVKYSTKENDLMLIGDYNDNAYLHYCLFQKDFVLENNRPFYTNSFIDELEKKFNLKTFQLKVRKLS